MKALRAVSAALAVVLLAGVASASIPGPTGVISACYTKTSGSLRVIDLAKGQKCTKYESPLAWNQSAPVQASGPSVVARARLFGSLLLPIDPDPSDATSTRLTLTGNTWVQAANEIDVIYPGTFSATMPEDCAQSNLQQERDAYHAELVAGGGDPEEVEVRLEQGHPSVLVWASGGGFAPQFEGWGEFASALTPGQVTTARLTLSPASQLFAFESGTPTSRVLYAEVMGGFCYLVASEGSTDYPPRFIDRWTLNGLSLDVVGIR